MNKGILLNEDNDLKIENGSVAIGDSMVQDAYIALLTSQGELKDDPLVGVNLTRMIRGRTNAEKMRKTIEIGLQRVGIRFDDIKDQLEASVNGETIQ